MAATSSKMCLRAKSAINTTFDFMLSYHLQEKPFYALAIIVIQQFVFSTDIFVVKIHTNSKIPAICGVSVYWQMKPFVNFMVLTILIQL